MGGEEPLAANWEAAAAFPKTSVNPGISCPVINISLMKKSSLLKGHVSLRTFFHPRHQTYPPALRGAPASDLSFSQSPSCWRRPVMVYTSGTCGGEPAPVTRDRGTCWGNGERQITHPLRSCLWESPSSEDDSVTVWWETDKLSLWREGFYFVSFFSAL